MRTNPFLLTASLGCVMLSAGCATHAPPTAAPPRLTLPEIATQPCQLSLLPDDATMADVEAVYAARGADLLVCDAARDLAVQTLLAERALIDLWLAPDTRRSFWKIW